MKQVEADAQHTVKMGPGTLYGSLKRMLDAGLVQESANRVDPEMGDERRIYYQMTDLGVKALASELGALSPHCHRGAGAATSCHNLLPKARSRLLLSIYTSVSLYFSTRVKM